MTLNRRLLILLFIFLSNISFSQNTEKDLLEIAKKETSSGNNKEAIKILTKVIKQNDKSAKAYNYRSIAKVNLGNYKSALKDLDKAIKINPNYATAYYNKGVIKYENLYDYVGAIQELDMAIGLNSINHNYYNYRGSCNAMLLKYEEALTDFNKSLIINPNNPFTIILRARIKKSLGRLNESLIDCDLALSVDSLYVMAYLLKGMVLYKKGELEDCCVNYKKVIELGADKSLETKIRRLCD